MFVLCCIIAVFLPGRRKRHINSKGLLNEETPVMSSARAGSAGVVWLDPPQKLIRCSPLISNLSRTLIFPQRLSDKRGTDMSI